MHVCYFRTVVFNTPAVGCSLQMNALEMINLQNWMGNLRCKCWHWVWALITLCFISQCTHGMKFINIQCISISSLKQIVEQQNVSSAVM
jgi:hypothetical protein